MSYIMRKIYFTLGKLLYLELCISLKREFVNSHFNNCLLSPVYSQKGFLLNHVFCDSVDNFSTLVLYSFIVKS